MDIKEIAVIAHKNAIEKGFWDNNVINTAHNTPLVVIPSIGEQFANFHAEISEAWEEYRSGRGMNEVYFNDGSNKPEGIPIELADCIIRILDTCEAYNIDIESAIKLKMDYNVTRSYRHGGKLA